MLGSCDMRASLPRIKAKTRIAVGAEDYATPVAMAQSMQAAIPGATLEVVPGVRHLTPLECPDKIAGILALAVRSHQLTLPPAGALLFGIVGSLLAIAAFSQAAVLLSLRCQTVRAASQRLLYGMLAVGFVPWLVIRKIVPGWGSALSAWAARNGAAAVSAACLVILLAAFCGLAIAARRVFRRDRIPLSRSCKRSKRRSKRVRAR